MLCVAIVGVIISELSGIPVKTMIHAVIIPFVHRHVSPMFSSPYCITVGIFAQVLVKSLLERSLVSGWLV